MTSSPTYEQQIDEAEKKLDEDPKDEKALTDLARYRYLAGQENLSFDEETGVATLTEEARSEWNLALDSWEQLLKLDPKQVDPQVAGQMVCAYVPPLPICQVQAPADSLDLAGAAATQRLLAEQDETSGAYAQLALSSSSTATRRAARRLSRRPWRAPSPTSASGFRRSSTSSSRTRPST